MVHHGRHAGTRERGNAPRVSKPASRCAFSCRCMCTLLAATLVIAAPLSAVADEVIDRVLAVVGGDVITLSDVRTARELGRVDVTGAADPLRGALTQLVDRSLVLSEVNRFAPPEPSATAVDAAFAALTSRFGSRSTMEAALQRLGIDESLVRELLSEDLRIRAYIDQRFTAETPAAQRALVDAWVAGLRRRAEIVDLYGSPSSASAQGTAGPARH